MNNPFSPGDIKKYSKIIGEQEIAEFESGLVHKFYATFFMAKDAEWSTRLFVLDMKEENEEGIGTFIEITHVAPALVNERVDFIAKMEAVQGNEIICSFEASVGDRIIGVGRTGQKILSKEKLNRLITRLEKK